MSHVIFKKLTIARFDSNYNTNRAFTIKVNLNLKKITIEALISILGLKASNQPIKLQKWQITFFLCHCFVSKDGFIITVARGWISIIWYKVFMYFGQRYICKHVVAKVCGTNLTKNIVNVWYTEVDIEQNEDANTACKKDVEWLYLKVILTNI